MIPKKSGFDWFCIIVLFHLPCLMAGNIPNLTCLNPLITSGQYSDTTMDPSWKLIQVTVHQRHLDRWIYLHPLINNYCWPGQLNSSDERMKIQCDYNIDSVWMNFTHTADPYSKPLHGYCTAMELTTQGIRHSYQLGSILKDQYTKNGLFNGDCDGIVGLETVEDQKNQITTQTVYQSLCGHLPDVKEFPERSVIDTGKVVRGRPFWLDTDVCGGKLLKSMKSEANDSMLESDYWNKHVYPMSVTFARMTNHSVPSKYQWDSLLDNIIDCTVSHYCHNLEDSPEEFSTDKELFSTADHLEISSRVYSLNYFKNKDIKQYNTFAKLYFGYYYKVLYDRMFGKIHGSPNAKSIYFQVTTDTIIMQQLIMLGLNEMASSRPIWGSTLVYELYQQNQSYAVRVIYNGKTAPICKNKIYCNWDEFLDILNPIIPSPAECPKFYDNYYPNLV